MIVGTTIFRFDGNPYFSPAFPRGGDREPREVMLGLTAKLLAEHLRHHLLGRVAGGTPR